jgi:hypothetical protein
LTFWDKLSQQRYDHFPARLEPPVILFQCVHLVIFFNVHEQQPRTLNNNQRHGLGKQSFLKSCNQLEGQSLS